MPDSYQREIPKARINITLDVDVGGAKKKKELPLKMLVMGDFTNCKTHTSIAQRDRLNINKDNFDQVMSELSPELICTVPNTIKKDGSDLKIHLCFQRHRDFHPAHIVSQVPDLNHLLAMRNLLKELKANILDNTNFRQELETIIREKSTLFCLRDELKQIALLKSDEISVPKNI